MAKKRWQAYLYLLLNTVCWGAALVIVKPALEFISPTRFLLYRFFFASLLSLPLFLRFAPQIKNLPKKLLQITAIELLGTTASLLILYTALSLTTAIEASLLGTTGPIFIVLLGVWLLKERQQRHEWVGLGLSFLGSLALVIAPLLNHNAIWSSQPHALLGNSLMVAYNLLNGWYFILAKKQYHALPKLFVTSVSFFVGLITFAILWLWEAQLSPIDFARIAGSIQADFSHPSVWMASLYMATFGSLIGLTAYIKGQDGIEASEASIFTYLQPLVYIPLGILLLAETIGLVQIFGLLLVICGVAVSSVRKSPWFR